MRRGWSSSSWPLWSSCQPPQHHRWRDYRLKTAGGWWRTSCRTSESQSETGATWWYPDKASNLANTLDDGSSLETMLCGARKGWIGQQTHLFKPVKSVTKQRPLLGFCTKNAGEHHVVGCKTLAMILSNNALLKISSASFWKWSRTGLAVVTFSVNGFKESSTNQAEVQFRKLETANTALATTIPSESEDIYAALDTENECLLSLLEKVATFMSDTEVSFAAASTDGTSGPRPASSRLVEDSLKPFTLSRDHTPQDLQTWIGQVEQYLRIGTIRTQPLDTQRAFLDRCIDSALLRDLRQFIAPDTAISGASRSSRPASAACTRFSITAWSSSGPSQPPARMPPPSSAALWTRPQRLTSSLSLGMNWLYLSFWRAFRTKRSGRLLPHGPFQSSRIYASSRISVWIFSMARRPSTAPRPTPSLPLSTPLAPHQESPPQAHPEIRPCQHIADLPMINALANLAANDVPANNVPSGLSAPRPRDPDVAIATAWITVRTIVLSWHSISCVTSVDSLAISCQLVVPTSLVPSFGTLMITPRLRRDFRFLSLTPMARFHLSVIQTLGVQLPWSPPIS